MMKHVFYFLFLILLFSCKKNDENLELKYEVINELISKNVEYHKMVKKNLGINDSTDYFVINYNFSVYDEKEWKTYSDSVRSIDPKIKIVVEPDDAIMLLSDSIFSRKDIEYLKKQIDKNKDFQIDQRKISLHTKFISQKEIDNILKHRRNYKGKGYVSFSVPLFNLKKDKCIIRAESCGIYPPGCAGGIIILQKKNGKWAEFIKSNHWVN